MWPTGTEIQTWLQELIAQLAIIAAYMKLQSSLLQFIDIEDNILHTLKFQPGIGKRKLSIKPWV